VDLDVCIFDVDGVLTTGRFFYTVEGKVMKEFGPDDNDALQLLCEFVEVRFVSGDRNGFNITKRRVVDDMGFKLDFVRSRERKEWISDIYDLEKVLYMGDGIFDDAVMKHVGYSIAPCNASLSAKEAANYITDCSGGDRAVAEACMHILKVHYNAYDVKYKADSA